jgi:hypothetical protein
MVYVDLNPVRANMADVTKMDVCISSVQEANGFIQASGALRLVWGEGITAN